MDIEVTPIVSLATGEGGWGMRFSIITDDGATAAYLLPDECERFVNRASEKLRELRDRIEDDT